MGAEGVPYCLAAGKGVLLALGDPAKRILRSEAALRALILVDVQRDFCPGGALAVPQGDEVVAVCNRLQRAYPLVVATQDWHPAGHGSFASSAQGRSVGTVGELQGLPQVWWPDHCVAGSGGAQFHPDLDLGRVAAIFRKGMDPQIDSYSGFADNGARRSTGLAAYLKGMGVTAVDVVGLATDYCVKATALDALAEGFATAVVPEACRAVNLQPGDGDKALAALQEAGVALRPLADVLAAV